MPKKRGEFDFEKTLSELENLVKQMEQGDITLEESLKHFERGISLTRACQKALADAEQKVLILMRNEQSETLESFTPEENNE